MKPAPFEYYRPASVDEACAFLAGDDGARIIAGGQTLVPLMAMRLARPTWLVDIARIPELSFIREAGGAIAIGAATRQCGLLEDRFLWQKLPLISKIMPFVGHEATRTRGTVGGSLANGDPAAELVLAAATLGATLVYREGSDTHEVPAVDFFIGPMLTALSPAACLTEVRFPVWSEPRVGVGFHEINARASDFAFVSAAAQVALDPDGTCTRAAVGIGAVAATPLRLEIVEQVLVGAPIEESKVRDAVRAAMADVEAMQDLHATAAYRKRVAVTLATRAVMDAVKDAHAR